MGGVVPQQKKPQFVLGNVSPAQDPRLTNSEVDLATAQKYQTQADAAYGSGNTGLGNQYRALADKLTSQAKGPASVMGGAAGPPTGQADRQGFNGTGYRGYDPGGYPQYTGNTDPSVALTRQPTAPTGGASSTGGYSAGLAGASDGDTNSFFGRLQELQRTDLASQTSLNQQLVDQGRQLSTEQTAQQKQFSDALLKAVVPKAPAKAKKAGGGFFGTPAKTQLGGALGALLGG